MGVIKTYLSNCSFHGLPYTADNRYHWTERLFWIIMVFLSWCVFGYIMLSSFDQFENGAVSFTVDTLYLDWESNFPAIVVCEAGNDKQSSFAEEWFNETFNEDYQNYLILKNIAFFEGIILGKRGHCDSDNDCPFIKANFSKYAEAIRSTCKELFLFCAWNDVEFSCCEQFMPMATIFGQCYAVNSLASSKTPTKPVYMNVSHKIGLEIGKLTVEVSNPDLSIFALSHDSVPWYSSDSNKVFGGISASPHSQEQTNIYLAIEEMTNDKNVKSTSIKRRRCRFIDENNLKHSKIYSYSACLLDCGFDIQLKKCNCNHHFMPSVDENKICDINGLICLSDAFDDIIKEVAKCVCEISCVNTEVKILGSIKNTNFLNFNNSKSVLQLNFILRAPTVRVLRNVAYGYLDLIVSMGGTAGLCVGASVLTIVEIFYYFIVRPISDYKIKKQTSKKKFLIKTLKKKNAVFPFVN